MSAPVVSGTITVDSFADVVDTTPGDGICANVPAGGWCSLRAAIQEANALNGAQTIILPAGTYTLALAGSGEDNAGTGDLDIKGDLTIIGAGGNQNGDPAATIVQAQSIPNTTFDRVFHVNPGGAGAVNATFKALTIRHGGVPGIADSASGGGIEFETSGNTSSLTVYNVVVDKNKTTGATNVQGGWGGGIDLYNYSTGSQATVLIERSVISNNSTTVASGGGINASGVNLTIRDSTISGNIPTWPSGPQGGGLYIGSNATVTIERSLITGNQVQTSGDGAGIYVAGGTVSIKSSTISGNMADSDAGGIYASTGSVTLTNVTMTANTANTGSGGGIRIGSGSLNMVNTIVSGNSSPAGFDEIAGSVSGTNNIVGSDGPGGLTNGVSGNKVGVDPLLGALGNYGGWTQTYKLQTGSPAIEAGTNAGAPTQDQRGFNRIADSADSDSTATADIGAYEAHPTISDIANQTSPATTPKAVPFYVGDSAQGVTITATSSNQSVVPNGNLVITNGSTYNPTLTVTGTSVGTATITVTVSASGQSETDTFVMTVTTPPKAGLPSVTGTTTNEDTQSTSGLVLSPNASDTLVTHFKITGITNGKLYKSDGTTEITNGTFITKAEGAAGLKFTPTANFNGAATFTVEAAYDNAGAGLSDPATATITVNPVNDPPTFTLGSDVTVLEDSGAYSAANFVTGRNAVEAGQSLTTIVTNDHNAYFSIQPAVDGSGTLTFTPALNAHGTATVSVSVSDNGGTANGGQDTTTKTFTITMSPINDPPSFTKGPDQTVSEDAGAQTVSNWATGISAGPNESSQTVTFEVTVTSNAGLFSVQPAIDPTGKLTYTPAPDATGTATITVLAKDNGGTASGGVDASSAQTFTITLTPVNDAPSAVNDTLSSVAEDSGPWTIPFSALTSNDSKGPADESSQTLTVTAVSNLTGGTVAISGTDVIFTPTADFNGTASFGYTVEDSGSPALTSTATASFTVTPVNDAPVGADDTLSAVDEDSAPRTIPFAALLANDSTGPADENGQTLSITAVGSATGGTAVISGSDVIFTLDPNFSGTASFTYTLADNGTTNGAPDPKTDTVTVTFAVNGVAEAPNVTAATTTEDTQSSSGLVITPDVSDGAAVTHYQVTGITGGWLYKSNGTTQIQNGDYITAAEGAAGLRFTPAPDLNTPAGDTFGFTVQAALDNAGTGLSPGKVVSITVTEVNDGPTGTDDNPAGALTEDYGTLTFNGADLVVNDSKGPANESGQTLTITAVDNVVGGMATVVGGNVQFTTAANFSGTASFRYTVSDNGTTGGSADPKTSTATVTFTITPMPDAPQISPTTTAEDTQSTSGLVVTPNALDGAEVTHFQITGITGGRLFKNDGTTEITTGAYITAAEGLAGLKFTPGADKNSPAGDTFGFTAKGALDGSGTGLSTGTSVSITVTEVNDAPSGTNDILSAVAEDSGELRIPFAALTGNDLTGPTDENGQSLTITSVAAITGGTVSISGTDVLFTPAADFYGTASFTYTLADNGTTNGGADPKTATATVSIPVDPVTDQPSITATTTAEDTQSSTGLVISRNGADGAEVAYFHIAGITGGRLFKNDGTTEITNGTYVTAAEGGAGLRFTPAADQNTPAGGTFTFTVKAALDGSGSGLSSTGATASITVTDVNDAPTGVDDSLSNLAEDSGPWTIPFAALTGNDQVGPNESGQALTVSAVSGAVGGTVAISGTDVLFTPDANFTGTASFAYTVTDNGTTGGAADPKSAATTATASFTVTEVNDAPTGADDTLSTVAEDSTPLIIPFADLVGNDSTGPANENLQSLTITSVSSPVGGTAAIAGSTVIFTLSPSFHGTASFIYTIADNGTTGGVSAPLTDTATVSFTVTPVADLPGITGATTAEDTQSSSGLVITRNSADGAEVTHFKITGITGGTLYQSNGTTAIANGSFITVAEGLEGLKFTPDADAYGTVGFGFTAQAALDNTGTAISGSSSVTITVTEVNDAPTGAGDTIADIPEDSGAQTISAATLLANDSKGPANESGQTLSITAADNAVGGSVDVVGGNVIFTPTANYAGPASFRYTLTDNGTTGGSADAKSSTATVTFTVIAMPDAPQISPATTAEDTQSSSGLVVTRNALDGAEVTHFEITGITGGTLYLNDGVTAIVGGDYITVAQGAAGLKFTPAADAHGTTGFGFTAKAALDNSGTGLSDGTAVAITVTEVNDDPIGTNDTLTAVLEDSAQLTIPFGALTSNDLNGPTNESDQSLTITAVSAVTGGTVSISGTDVLFTPAANFYGTASFSYTLQDDGTTAGVAAPKSATATVNIPVTAVADTPSVTATTTAEDTQSGSGLVISRNAADGAEVTHYQITGITGGTLYKNDGSTAISNGSYITAAEGAAGLKFTPTTDAYGSAGFGVTVKAALDGSGTGLSATGATVSITVTEVNDAPTGVADTLSDVAEDSGPWTIPFTALTSNDQTGPNESAQSLTVIAVSAPVGGTVAISGTDVIFTPTPEFNGTASFTYTLQDNGTTNGSADPLTATATASFTVTTVNDAPTGADDTLSPVAEDAPAFTIPFADLVGNDLKGPADENGQSLTITAVSGAVGGTAEISGTNVLFTLAPNFNGTAGFTYTVSDNGTSGGVADPQTDTADVTFTVTPVADQPTVTPATTPEDTKSSTGLVITRNAADGAEVTHFKITGITGGTLYLTDGTTTLANGDFITAAQGAAGLKFAPNGDANGTTGFGFLVQGAQGPTETAISGTTTVAITVTVVNDDPSGVDDTLSAITEDASTITISGATLVANDSKGPANESGQSLTVTGADTAVGGTVSVVDGDVLFTPTANFYGPASFRYTVTDNGTTNGAADPKSSTATVSFTITPTPDAPQITAATTAEETQSTTGLVVTRHADDGAEITHFQVSGITGGRLFKNDGTSELHVGDLITVTDGAAGLKFTPETDANTPNGGTFGVSLKAHDSLLNLTGPESTATITVTEVNDAPWGANDTLADVAEDNAAFRIPFAALLTNDLVGPNESVQSLTITNVMDAVGGTVAIDGTDVLFTPEADYNGPASFTYTLQDNGTTGGAADPKTATATVNFVITEVNDAPTGVADTLADQNEDAGPWTIPFATLLGNDLKGPANEGAQSLTVTAVGGAVGGTVEISGTDVIFTSTLNFNGTASFTYTVTDDGTTAGTSTPKSASTTATFTVIPVNDPPVAEDQVLSVTVVQRLNGQLTATDVDPDTLTYILVDAPTRGEVRINPDGSFSYLGHSAGTDSFTFKANDGTVDSNIATVTITVRNSGGGGSPAPILTISVPTTLTRESSILVSGTANPGYTIVVAGKSVTVDSQGLWSTTVELVEGPNVITATNLTLSQSVTVTRDTRPPQIELFASAERTEEETVVLTAYSEQGAVIEIEGQRVSTLTVSLKMGANKFTAKATDAAGNESTDSVTVLRVGNVPPVVVKPGESGEASTQYFKVQLPGEAVTEVTLLEVSSPSRDTAAVRQAEGAARVAMTGDLEAKGQSSGAAIHLLHAPATVTFIYDPKQVPNPSALRIYYFDPDAKVWVEVGGVVDLVNNLITVQVEHFTTFAAMEPQQEAPILNVPPAQVRSESLTFTGTFKPNTPVTLVVNRVAQTTVQTDATGHFSLEGRLTAGKNFVYVKGTGTLASREMTVTYQTSGYTDIGTHWAKEPIERLERLSVLSLYPYPLFKPEAKVTRLEFAVMVGRVLGLKPVNEAPTFADTESMPLWARPEVSAAVKAGIIKGMPDGSFAPEALVTRAEMAIMLTRALQYAGKGSNPGDRVFSDQAQIPDWALQQVLTATKWGLITGYPDGSFGPANNTTRAEAVTMLNRLLDAVKR